MHYFYQHSSLFEGSGMEGMDYIYQHSSLFEGSGGGVGCFIYFTNMALARASFPIL
ncbi:MAG: hypothetical protein LCH52_01390 [Bacteroidetes bacterium]|nr:hypothetical protein [Bacteroidota bacterium]